MMQNYYFFCFCLSCLPSTAKCATHRDVTGKTLCAILTINHFWCEIKQKQKAKKIKKPAKAFRREWRLSFHFETTTRTVKHFIYFSPTCFPSDGLWVDGIDGVERQRERRSICMCVRVRRISFRFSSLLSHSACLLAFGSNRVSRVVRCS